MSKKIKKISPNKTAIVTKPFTMVSCYEPFKVIRIDTVGRFPKDRNDNRYLIVIIDNCTRVVKLTQHKTLQAIEAVRALTNQISRYGAPYTINSDNGTQYVPLIKY